MTKNNKINNLQAKTLKLKTKTPALFVESNHHSKFLNGISSKFSVQQCQIRSIANKIKI